MSESTVATFHAGASMLGYLYQVRVALLWAVRQSRIGDFSVSVETLDDVSFEASGDPIAVLQTKHAVHSTSGLSDLGPDLWKTLRIWMVGRFSGEVPITTAKFLISTSVTSAGTACSALVPESDRCVVFRACIESPGARSRDRSGGRQRRQPAGFAEEGCCRGGRRADAGRPGMAAADAAHGFGCAFGRTGRR